MPSRHVDPLIVRGVIVAHGTVKWFNGQKGYGFIEQADGSKDVLLHVNEQARYEEHK